MTRFQIRRSIENTRPGASEHQEQTRIVQTDVGEHNIEQNQ